MAPSSSDQKDAVKLIQAAVVVGDLSVFKKAVRSLEGKDEGISETIYRVSDKYGYGALHWAAAQGRREICQYLIEKLGFDVNLVASEHGMTPLLRACHGPLATFEGSTGDRISTIQYLLDQGADVAIRDKGSNTALHAAISRGDAEVVEILVSKGGPLDEPNNLRETPLLLTAFAKSERLMKILLNHKADPNMVQSDFVTPLLICAVNNSIDCAKLLIKFGADANKENILDWTVFGRLKEMLHVLLDGGADPNIPNEFGRLPIEVAAIEGRRDLVEMLFPRTFPIPTVSDWSVNGLFRHIQSPSFKRAEEILFKKRMERRKDKIEDAIKKEDSLGSTVLCTHAINEDPRDASLYANRSLAFMLSRNSKWALEDALQCMHLQPNWPISYLRVASALKSLKKYKEVIVVLIAGVGLDVSNEEMQNELWEAVECAKRASHK